jgi:hypothetical protein
MDEVHSKLVEIMRDRLGLALAQLPQELANVNIMQPNVASPCLVSLARQLMTLKAVLGPLLLRDEVDYIFGAVTRFYSEQLSETFEGLLSKGSVNEAAVKANALHMLQVNCKGMGKLSGFVGGRWKGWILKEDRLLIELCFFVTWQHRSPTYVEIRLNSMQ